jgi:hypothetical protein
LPPKPCCMMRIRVESRMSLASFSMRVRIPISTY